MRTLRRDRTSARPDEGSGARSATSAPVRPHARQRGLDVSMRDDARVAAGCDDRGVRSGRCRRVRPPRRTRSSTGSLAEPPARLRVSGDSRGIRVELAARPARWSTIAGSRCSAGAAIPSRIPLVGRRRRAQDSARSQHRRRAVRSAGVANACCTRSGRGAALTVRSAALPARRTAGDVSPSRTLHAAEPARRRGGRQLLAQKSPASGAARRRPRHPLTGTGGGRLTRASRRAQRARRARRDRRDARWTSSRGRLERKLTRRRPPTSRLSPRVRVDAERAARPAGARPRGRPRSSS